MRAGAFLSEDAKGARLCRAPSISKCCADLLDRTSDLAGTQAAGAGVNVTRGTVLDHLNTFDVGFPRSVGPSVRVRNLESKGHALTADIAFRHLSAPPL